MASWLPISPTSDFSLQNLPYGIFSTSRLSRRIGVAVGDNVLDLKVLSEVGVFDNDLSQAERDTLCLSRLNEYAALGRDVQRKVRRVLQDLLREEAARKEFKEDIESGMSKVLVAMENVTMHLPFDVGDYTDFLLGSHHARNCTEILRPGSSLHPNYTSLPVAYHGRASSVVVSVEFAAFVGRGNEHGKPIPIDEAEEHIFGVVLMNNWSARDIQAWESTLLGPFAGKNFGTTVSPWVVTLNALKGRRTKDIEQDERLPYLTEKGSPAIFDIPLEVSLKCTNGDFVVARCNTKYVSFSLRQIIAHHTAGGFPLLPGDLLATGTLSGETREALGCLLEISKDGVERITLKPKGGGPGDAVRTFLEDGDVVEFRAMVQNIDGNGNAGFGVCAGQVLPCPV